MRSEANICKKCLVTIEIEEAKNAVILPRKPVAAATDIEKKKKYSRSEAGDVV